MMAITGYGRSRGHGKVHLTHDEFSTESACSASGCCASVDESAEEVITCKTCLAILKRRKARRAELGTPVKMHHVKAVELCSHFATEYEQRGEILFSKYEHENCKDIRAAAAGELVLR